MAEVAAPLWFPSGGQLWEVAPELALVGTILAVLILSLIDRRDAITTALVVLVGVTVTAVLTGELDRGLGTGTGGGGPVPPGGGSMLVVDGLSTFFKLFLMLFLALVTALWLVGLRARRTERPRAYTARAPEFFVLVLGSALGMVLMAGTLNLLMIVIAVEMASLPSYVLAAFHKHDRRGAEASLKYVVFGAATAAIAFYGASLLYGYYGTLDVSLLARRSLAEAEGGRLPGVAAVGLLALLVGIGFKVAAVPFHYWCPDVFEGAPVEVATWLSVASKGAGLVLGVRVMMTLAAAAGGTAESLWGPPALVVGLLAVLTCTVGNLAAYRQTHVRRILAYSSIAHAGYMLMPATVVVAPPGGAAAAGPPIAAVAAYLLIYLFMNLGAFGVTAMVSWRTGSEDLSAFAGLGRRAPWLAVPMAVCLFSLVGLPPLGGFIAKWWVLYALGQGAAAQSWLWGLVIVLVLNTLLSLYYYMRIVLWMFLREAPAADGELSFGAPAGGVVLVNLCALILLLLGTIGVGPLKAAVDDYAARVRLRSESVAGAVAVGTVELP